MLKRSEKWIQQRMMGQETHVAPLMESGLVGSN